MSGTAVDDRARGWPVTFVGRRGELLALILVNIVLTLVTAGIYRFWARTRIRRFYWHSIAIDQDPLEYTGRGIELFLGFLIVLAVFIPLVLGLVVVQTFLIPKGSLLAVVPNLAIFVGAWWLYGYAIYRARRYRLTRTLWRGIRFGQDGSPARYAWKRFGWSLLLPLTFGIVYPWYQVALRRHEMRHTRFGFTHFDYAGHGRDLFRYWWPVLLSAVVFFATMIAFMASTASTFNELASDPNRPFDPAMHVPLVQNPLGIVLVVLAGFAAFAHMLLRVRYRVAALRYLFDVSSLAGITARSGARSGRVILYGLTIGAAALVGYAVLAGYFVVVVAAAHTYGASAQFDVGLILILLAFGLIFRIVYQVFFVFPLTRHVATTVETTDLAALGNVVQGTRDDPRFGEGLLDALDIDLDFA